MEKIQVSLLHGMEICSIFKLQSRKLWYIDKNECMVMKGGIVRSQIIRRVFYSV